MFISKSEAVQINNIYLFFDYGMKESKECINININRQARSQIMRGTILARNIQQTFIKISFVAWDPIHFKTFKTKL